jgi:hypothetical protein
VLVVLSLQPFPVLPVLSAFRVLAVLFWLSCSSSAVLPVLFWPSSSSPLVKPWLSYPSNPVLGALSGRRPVLAALSWPPFLGSPVLAVLFRQSCSACPVLPVLFCLSYSICPVLPVLFCLGCSLLAVYCILYVYVYRCTSVKGNWECKSGKSVKFKVQIRAQKRSHGRVPPGSAKTKKARSQLCQKHTVASLEDGPASSAPPPARICVWKDGQLTGDVGGGVVNLVLRQICPRAHRKAWNTTNEERRMETADSVTPLTDRQHV